MNDIEIIDNYLNFNEFTELKNNLESSWFPWFFNDFVLEENLIEEDDEDFLFDYQFVHPFYRDGAPVSQSIQIIMPLISKLNVLALIRVKANLSAYNTYNKEKFMHVDSDVEKHNVKAAIFYIDDSDGYTVFEDGERVYSKQNRLVIFDANLKHAGVNTTNNKKRILINLNYLEK